MSAPPKRKAWRGPPLALQMMGLLIGGLVVAQLVTLLLTLLLPPEPTPQYGLDDIAAALHGETPESASGRTLQRLVQAGPPDISGPGWLISERSRRELAGLLNAAPGDVSLAFYTPLPFAGTAAPPAIPLKANDGPLASLRQLSANGGEARLILAQATVPPPPAPPPPPPPGGFPNGLQRGRDAPPRDALPPGIGPGAAPPGAGAPGPRGAPPDIAAGGGGAGLRPPPLRPGSLFAVDPSTVPENGLFIPGDQGAAVPPLLQGGAGTVPPAATAPPPTAAGNAPIEGAPAFGRGGPFGLGGPVGPGGPGGAALEQPFRAMQQLPQIERRALAGPIVTPPPLIAPAPTAAETRRAPFAAPTVAPIPFAPAIVAPGPAPAPMPPPTPEALPEATTPSGPPIAVTAPPRGLFGLAPAPFVEGDFVAALRLADSRWAVVQPAPEPFPNAWQRRVLLWFAIALAIVGPLGWLFTRRLVKPLGQFAGAAERLGRDPAGQVIAVDGPAEIGRAAHAFNLMQTRLRTFVDDRTAMIGAISHDLRTPLTRMRFRIEDVPDDVREGLLEEVTDMEAMITSVLEFIRDASSPGVRERLDLSMLVGDVVEDRQLVGNDVRVERTQATTVDIDVLGIRRVLDNLLENAVKYGARARIRLTTEGGDAVAEILDDGPGLPDDELERVFEPFYRGESARAEDKAGHGLGLAVCRSIARAHGGDVRLRRSGDGFLAEMRLPLAYDA